MAGGADVVGVDISGRHQEAGEYVMVAAAVAADIGSSRINGISGIGLSQRNSEPTLENALAVVASAVDDLPEPPNGTIVSERGEFYETPARTVGVSFDLEFKYVESIAERKTVEAAHHAAYAARNLIR